MIVVHLHEEQMDGRLHAACGRLAAKAPDPRIATQVMFATTRRANRCPDCDVRFVMSQPQ